MSVRKQAFDYFRSQGWSAEQSAGIVANLIAESNLNPSAVGDRGTAFGLGQWRGSRQSGLATYLGKPIADSTFEEQLAWVHEELTSSEEAAGAALRACTTAAEAGSIVSRYYERPADREGEALKRARLAEQILAEASTTPTAAPSVAPAPDSSLSRTIPEESTMLPALIPALLPAILESIPALASIFAKGPRGQDNAKAATVVVEAVTKAVNATNAQEAVEKIKADPVAREQAQTAVLADPVVQAMLVGEIGGGITAARTANVAVGLNNVPLWRDRAFLMAVLLLPLLYWAAGAVLMNWGGGWVQETRSGVVNLVLGTILGGVIGYFFGTTAQSAKKDELIARRADG